MLALLFLVSIAPAAAATVLVKVVDENGSPVQRPYVYLQRGDDAVTGNPLRHHRHVQADSDGNARFDDVQAGHYVVGARTYDTLSIRGEETPLAPRVRLTIDDPDQVVEVQLELHRGTLLCTRFVIDGSQLDAWAHLMRQELESGYSTDQHLKREQESCEPLFAGRWELRLAPPGGYLLVDLDVNGTSVAGSVAQIDVRPGSRTQYVTWYLMAPARLEGTVYFDGESFPVTIRADLIEGGEWLAGAEARGGSHYTPVLAFPDTRTRDYAMDLPDGWWRVRPIGDGLIEADPSEIELEISAGEHRRLDFTLRGGSSESAQGLEVSVSSPSGERVNDAIVELWPADPGQRGESPLARARTQRGGSARLSNLEPGTYRLVAGHKSYRETAQTITFDPEDDDTRSQSIQLRQATDLTVLLQSAEETDTRGGAVELARVDGAIETELAEERFLRRLRKPSAEFDATGRARVLGIYAGTYRVKAYHDRVFYEFKQGSRWVEEAEVSFGDAESVQLEARAVPAATVAGSLYCEGGEPMPTRAEVRVVRPSARPADPLDDAWEAGVVFEREVLLGGEQRDAFRVGPLQHGSYLIAVQPATFGRWTWAFGTEDGNDAQAFEVNAEEQVDLGEIAVDCSPAVRITLDVPSDRGVPDLSETSWQRDLEFAATVVTQEGKSLELRRPTVERYERLMKLRDLPEGELRGEIWLRHDYFVPDEWVYVPIEGTLSRGVRFDVVMPVVDVGGAIELTDASRSAEASLLVSTDGAERVELFQDGAASFRNLSIGTYQMQLCADAACENRLGDPEAIEVTELRTIKLKRPVR